MKLLSIIAAWAISFRGKFINCLSTSLATAWARLKLFVISIARARLSCSACDNKSAAISLAWALSSAKIPISDGPATISIATVPKTCFLAVATKMLPGPTILSTGLIVSVP